MNHAHRTSLGLIVVACCLATCLSGCQQLPLGQRLVSHWRVRFGNSPSFPMEVQIDPHQAAAESEGEVAPLPEDQMHEDVAAELCGQECDEEPVCPEDECESCDGPLAGLRCRLSSKRGRLRGLFQQATTVEYYNHPRFHPVPTRPVFQASVDSIAAGQPWMSPTSNQMPTSGALPNPPPPVEVNPPPMPPTPENIRTPDPEPSRKDRLTRGPQRPVERRAASSWIFQPSAAPSGQAVRHARAYPTAKGWTQTY